MEKSILTLNELSDRCTRNGLTALFPLGLRSSRFGSWTVTSAQVDRDLCRAEFTLTPDGEGLPLRAFWESRSDGERVHIEPLGAV